jgi:DNA-binding NarL/FixJ family response regulator
MSQTTYSPTRAKKRVLLVDDYAPIRTGLTCLINAEPDLVVCGEAENESQALTVTQELQPDVAVVDWCLGKWTASGLVSALSHRQPPVPVLVLSIYDERLYAEQAVHAGARAYVMKHEATDKIIETIRRVANNQPLNSRQAASSPPPAHATDGSAHKAALFETLTEAEKEALRLIADGHSTARIAQRFGLRLQDFISLRESLKTKLRLGSTTELFQTAPRWMAESRRSEQKR